MDTSDCQLFRYSALGSRNSDFPAHRLTDNNNATIGFRYRRASNKFAYTKGYMMAVTSYFQAFDVAVLNREATAWNDSFDLANATDARAASDWMKGWLDGRDRLNQ